MILDCDCDFLEDIPDCTFCTCVEFCYELFFPESMDADSDDFLVGEDDGSDSSW